jgi:hypothetical protein
MVDGSDTVSPCYVLTRHAERRAQQRGISLQTIEWVLAVADILCHAGEGCISYRVSRRALSNLRQEGVAAQLIERAAGIVVLVQPQNREIVTVLHDLPHKGRRYRSQWPTHTRRAA